MMSAILVPLALIASMDRLTDEDVTTPSCAASRASSATLSARRALSAFCFTVLVISSMDAAVSSSELACFCADEDNCSAAELSSWEPLATDSAVCKTRSEEHTSELQSQSNLLCPPLLVNTN